MGQITFSHSILVDVVLNLLKELNLFSLVVESNIMGICSSKEVFKNFKSISAESISLLSTEFTWNSLLEDLLSIAVVGFSEFRSRKNFKSFANLAEFEVNLGHALRVFVWVVGKSKNSELGSNFLE